MSRPEADEATAEAAAGHQVEAFPLAVAKRILAVHPVPDMYGADLMLLRSLSAMRRRHLDVTLYVPEDGPLLELVEEAGIDFRVVPFPVLRKALLSPLPFVALVLGLPWQVFKLVRAIRKAQPDILYVNTLTLPHWLLAGKLAGVPTVCHVRELEQLSNSLLTRGLTSPLLLADRLITNSRATSQFLIGCWGKFSSHCHVVYNGFTFPDHPREPPRESGRSRVVLVGRLSPRKGQDLAIEALATLVAEGYDVELELIGSTFRGYEWFEEDLASLASDRGVADRVIFSGFKAPVWNAYAAADIAVVPSRLEPFGSVAVEAMAMGRPVIVARVGGLPEIVDHERTGLVVAADDAAALTSALRRLLNDPGWAAAMGEKASAVVRQKYTQQRYERELIDVVVDG